MRPKPKRNDTTALNEVVGPPNGCVSYNFSQNVTHLKPRRKACPHTVKQQAAGQRPARTQCILLCVFVKIRPFGKPPAFSPFFRHQKESVCGDAGIVQWGAINSPFGLQQTKGQEVSCSFFC